MGNYAWVIVGFAMMIIGAISISKARRKAARCSAPAVATITSVEKVQRMNDEGKNMKGHDYTPVFTYVVDGQTYEKRADVSSGRESEFVVGAALNILYNPGNPNEAVIAGKSAKSSKAFGAALILFGVVIMIVGAIAQ